MHHSEYIDRKFEDLGINPEQANMVFFWGHRAKNANTIDKACCSQWWSSSFTLNGYNFVNAEQAMMHGKALLFNDKEIAEKILSESDPKQIKALGKQVKGFNDAIWYQNHYKLILEINSAKFSQDAALRAWLLNHPNNTVFVEASPYDGLWGIKQKNDGQLNLTNIAHWQGFNKLGFAITEVLQNLKQV